MELSKDSNICIGCKNSGMQKVADSGTFSYPCGAGVDQEEAERTRSCPNFKPLIEAEIMIGVMQFDREDI